MTIPKGLQTFSICYVQEARMRRGEEGANPDKSRPRGVGFRRVVERSPVEIRWGYRQILSQLVVKNVIWKVKHCKGGRRGGFDGRWPKSSNKQAAAASKQQEKQQQAAESGAAQTAQTTSSVVF